MRANARAAYESLYTPDRNYQMMMSIFEAAIARKDVERRAPKAAPVA
jgi:hypothetical protein